MAHGDVAKIWKEVRKLKNPLLVLKHYGIHVGTYKIIGSGFGFLNLEIVEGSESLSCIYDSNFRTWNFDEDTGIFTLFAGT